MESKGYVVVGSGERKPALDMTMIGVIHNIIVTKGGNSEERKYG